MALHRVPYRWMKQMPLPTQQLRLRSLIQIIAYNVTANHSSDLEKRRKIRILFYYTLHLTSMSAPFYTSEKLENCNPKWSEFEINKILNSAEAAVNGIVVRLWVHYADPQQDDIITAWGVFFSGLVYLGPRLTVEPSALRANSLIFQINGGYFTSPHCFQEEKEPDVANTYQVNLSDLRPSYSLNRLLMLQATQHSIRKQTELVSQCRQLIIKGGFATEKQHGSATLRRIMNQLPPKVSREQLNQIRSNIESISTRLQLLVNEKNRKFMQLKSLHNLSNSIAVTNEQIGESLMEKKIGKESINVKESRKNHNESREVLLHANARLLIRQRQLISEIDELYPIKQLKNNNFTICGIHLPNSENFIGTEDIMISVALGFVAHAVQLISVILQVPLRYPIVHFGSRSKIIDFITINIPDKDREFPLYSRGKEKIQFNYGVYLLNKNIAQLRWYCGLPTHDLRETLPNLSSLIHSRAPNSIAESPGVTGSCGDIRTSTNASPASSLPTGLNKVVNEVKSHRISKSMGSSDIQLKLSCPEEDRGLENWMKQSASSNISYSLDKGLDEYEEIKKLESIPQHINGILQQCRILGNVGQTGSEPVLTPSAKEKLLKEESGEGSSCDEAQRQFLETWKDRGPVPIVSDDDAETPLLSQTVKENETEDFVVDDSCVYLSVALQNKGTENGDVANEKTNFDDRIAEQKLLCEQTDRKDGDLLFENVASRTEALANRKTSFNLMKSHHSNAMNENFS